MIQVPCLHTQAQLLGIVLLILSIYYTEHNIDLLGTLIAIGSHTKNK